MGAPAMRLRIAGAPIVVEVVRLRVTHNWGGNRASIAEVHTG